jgi:two-component system, sensor histidine kinase
MELKLKPHKFPEQESEAVHIYTGKRYRILLIEDNELIVETTRILLHADGHEVKAAFAGAEGIELAKLFKPQVILCDIGLPGMDGYKVAHALRQLEELSSCYIIALTGYRYEDKPDGSSNSDFDLYLPKPLDYNHLCRILTQIALPDKANASQAGT